MNYLTELITNDPLEFTLSVVVICLIAIDIYLTMTMLARTPEYGNFINADTEAENLRVTCAPHDYDAEIEALVTKRQSKVKP